MHTPTLIVAGDRDAEVPISQSYEFWNALRRLGIETEFVVYPDEGHFFFKHGDQTDVATRLIDWFNTHIAPKKITVRSPAGESLPSPGLDGRSALMK